MTIQALIQYVLCLELYGISIHYRMEWHLYSNTEPLSQKNRFESFGQL